MEEKNPEKSEEIQSRLHLSLDFRAPGSQLIGSSRVAKRAARMNFTIFLCREISLAPAILFVKVTVVN